MIARYASAATSGAIITFSLFVSMQALIELQPGAQSEPRVRTQLNFVRLHKPESPIQTLDTQFRKEELTDAPIPPPARPAVSDRETINLPRNSPLPPSDTSRMTIGRFSDGPLVALVRVEPTYPARALAQGLQGYALVQFDVTVQGRVTNAVVIESSHSVFDGAAIKAAQKFKFKPRIVDGVSLETYGIQNLFRFELDE